MKFQIRSLFMITTAAALLLAIVREFLSTATDSRGILAGGLTLMIGTVVGGIIGTQRAPRIMIQVIGFIFFAALLSGAIDRVQDERTMWAFACMSLGLIWGACFRVPHFDGATHEDPRHPPDDVSP